MGEKPLDRYGSSSFKQCFGTGILPEEMVPAPPAGYALRLGGDTYSAEVGYQGRNRIDFRFACV
jgi:hypothetical protein